MLQQKMLQIFIFILKENSMIKAIKNFMKSERIVKNLVTNKGVVSISLICVDSEKDTYTALVKHEDSGEIKSISSHLINSSNVYSRDTANRLIRAYINKHTKD